MTDVWKIQHVTIYPEEIPLSEQKRSQIFKRIEEFGEKYGYYESPNLRKAIYEFLTEGVTVVRNGEAYQVIPSEQIIDKFEKRLESEMSKLKKDLESKKQIKVEKIPISEAIDDTLVLIDKNLNRLEKESKKRYRGKHTKHYYNLIKETKKKIDEVFDMISKAPPGGA